MNNNRDDTWKTRVDIVRASIQNGCSVVVYGWIASNHNDFTRYLAREGRVTFETRAPKQMPTNAAVILFTRFCDHSEHARARAQCKGKVWMMPIREIRRALEACKDLFTAPPRVQKERQQMSEETLRSSSPTVPETMVPAAETSMPHSEAAPPAPAAHLPLLLEVDKKAIFARRFLEAAGPKANRMVGKYAVSDLVREVFGVDDRIIAKIVASLVLEGWIEGVVSEGHSKIGSYRAGSRMIEAGSKSAVPDVEPNDPIERARWLVAQEITLLTEKEQLATRLGVIEEHLTTIDKAKGLLSSLAALLGEKK